MSCRLQGPLCVIILVMTISVVVHSCPGGDYSAMSLQTVTDVVYFHVFDEDLVDLLEDERRRATNIHQRRERHWLGSFSIPFQTIYANSRVCLLNRPFSFNLCVFTRVVWK